jgi:hypothetical protein
MPVLGPGFAPEVFALFDTGSGVQRREWCLVAFGRRLRCLRASELESDDLFALPPTWEITRVVPRHLTRRRHGRVAVTGLLFCRPRGSWEMMQLPFLHVWTLSRGRASRFENFLDGIDLRLADSPQA